MVYLVTKWPNLIDKIGWVIWILVHEEVVARVDRHESLQVSRESAPKYPWLVVTRCECFSDA